MGRRAISLVLILVGIFVFFRFCNNKPEKKADLQDEKETPIAVGANSGPFNQSFSALLQSYYNLSDGLMAADTVLVNNAAKVLIQRSDSLRVNEIKGDTSGMIKETAVQFTQAISASAGSLVQADGLENKRHEFEMITDALWSLTRTVRYDAQKVYYQYCPMAFDNKGAYWLSNSTEIRNPYFGAKMPKCGEVADSLDYSKR